MIILEGPDNVGKTVAARKLVTLLPGGHYVHYSKPPEGFDYWFDYLKDLNPGVVLDRFHLGAIAYGTILGGHEHTVPRVQWAALIRLLRFRGALVVVMYDGNEAGYADRVHATSREEMYSPAEQVVVNRVYKEMAHGELRGARYADVAYDISAHGFPSMDVLKEWVTLQRRMP